MSAFRFEAMRGVGRQKLFVIPRILKECSQDPFSCPSRHLTPLFLSSCLEVAVNLQVHQVNREDQKYANDFITTLFSELPLS